MYPITTPREEGKLPVSEKHTLFYALYGNPKGIPVVLLHGGPGAGCSDFSTCHFDLSRYNVVMFDQRGAMRSTPFLCMEENTSQHLVDDIEKLRKHLGIEKWLVFGGSWGSTLALLYGQTHPQSCLGFILRGIFLARPGDAEHLFSGMGKMFPEAFAPVLDYIPSEERHDLISAYYKRVNELEACRVFMRYDTICSTHQPNPLNLEKVMQNDQLVRSLSTAFFHYTKNKFFIRPYQILEEMDKIKHLPAIIVHGRYDAICLPEMAYTLHKKWPQSKLWIIPDGGHSGLDPAIAQALAKATDEFIC